MSLSWFLSQQSQQSEEYTYKSLRYLLTRIHITIYLYIINIIWNTYEGWGGGAFALYIGEWFALRMAEIENLISGVCSNKYVHYQMTSVC